MERKRKRSRSDLEEQDILPMLKRRKLNNSQDDSNHNSREVEDKVEDLPDTLEESQLQFEDIFPARTVSIDDKEYENSYDAKQPDQYEHVWAILIPITTAIQYQFTALISKDTYSIGRAPWNDLIVSDPHTSGRHASVVNNRIRGKKILYETSLNGTLINDKRIKDTKYILNNGDLITLNAMAKWYFFVLDTFDDGCDAKSNDGTTSIVLDKTDSSYKLSINGVSKTYHEQEYNKNAISKYVMQTTQSPRGVSDIIATFYGNTLHTVSYNIYRSVCGLSNLSRADAQSMNNTRTLHRHDAMCGSPINETC
eukprot:398012_1